MVSKRASVDAYVEHRVREQREWLATNDNFFVDRAATLQQVLQDSSFEVLLRASMLLRGLSNYYGVRGELSVYEGLEGGWGDVGRSLNYAYWSIRIRLQISAQTQFLRGGGPQGLSTDSLTPISNLLCAALVAHSDPVRRTLGNALWLLSKTQPETYSTFMAPRSFEPFALWLSSQASSGAVAPDSGAISGVYGEVVAAWNDPGALGGALRDACDYHCMHMSYSKKKAKSEWDLEFDAAPFDLVPIEVMAIGSVREAQGLPMPAFEHPLLNPTLTQPAKIDFINDKVTQRVEGIAFEIFGRQFSPGASSDEFGRSGCAYR